MTLLGGRYGLAGKLGIILALGVALVLTKTIWAADSDPQKASPPTDSSVAQPKPAAKAGPGDSSSSAAGQQAAAPASSTDSKDSSAAPASNSSNASAAASQKEAPAAETSMKAAPASAPATDASDDESDQEADTADQPDVQASSSPAKPVAQPVVQQKLPAPVISTAPAVAPYSPAVRASSMTNTTAPESTLPQAPTNPAEVGLQELLKKAHTLPAPDELALEHSTAAVYIDKVSVDDAGTRLLIIIQTSRPVECFVFERRDPASLYVQFMSTQPVYASGDPVQVVGNDPLAEIRYGYSSFHDATAANRESSQRFPIDYLELRLNRAVFYHVQQEGWVLVIGLDKTATKVEVPELNFRFEAAKYEGAANLPTNPRMEDFVQTAQSNSRLLSVARDEAELAKARVFEAKRAMLPGITGRISATRGREVNPFPQDNFNGFEATAFRRDEYGLQITQPIYQSGRLYGAFKQAKLNRLMAQENVRKQAQDLTYEVRKAFYSLLRYQSILRIRRELVAQGEVIKDMVRKKLKLQLTAKSEVLNVTAQADQAAYQLTSDDQDVALARLVIISLINQAEAVPDPVPGALTFARMSFNVESIIAWAQEHRPDVRIAMLNTELARYNWEAAEGDKSVKLDASGFVGKAGASFSDDNFVMHGAWNVGLRLSDSFGGNGVRASFSKEHTAPDLGQSFVTETQQKSLEVSLLDQVPGVSAAKQAQLQYERSKAELVEASRKAEYEVRETFYNLEKAGRQLDAAREDLKYRQKDLEITREKVKLGLSELSQLMAAEVSYAQSQITEQDALSAYNIALAAMDRVAGAEVIKQ